MTLAGALQEVINANVEAAGGDGCKKQTKPRAQSGRRRNVQIVPHLLVSLWLIPSRDPRWDWVEEA